MIQNSMLFLFFLLPCGKIISVSGADQGLAGIASSGSYDVGADLLLVDGQKEIFGWSHVNASRCGG
ncbi:MAG: hypothetical protein BWY40_00768 [bacterium ADurb.Bin270]|nr:MAG: hypothetical protein BWY40_00768 [bacterium ADurb.Bin270]